MTGERIRDVASSLVGAGVDDATLPCAYSDSQVAEQACFPEPRGCDHMKEACAPGAGAIPALTKRRELTLATDEIDDHPARSFGGPSVVLLTGAASDSQGITRSRFGFNLFGR